MRIAIIAIGTRGDVEPCVALGLGLQSAGHDVKLLTHANFEQTVTGGNLTFCPVADDARSIRDSYQGRRITKDESGRFQSMSHFWTLIRSHLRQILRDCLAACQDAEILIASPLGVLVGYHVAEKLGLPLVRAFYLPMSPTRSYPAPLTPQSLKLGGRFNLMTHALVRQLLWLVIRSDMNAMRSEDLQLPTLSLREPFRRMDQQKCLLLYGYSSAVVPRPYDWGDWTHVTGYWFLDRPEGWVPPPDLVDFIESGPSPVFVGFGSMRGDDPERSTELVVKALRAARQRAVLSAGWGGLDKLAISDDVYTIDEVPHDWLFPRMAAVVHHGGAGTTGRGLHSGVPGVIVPFFADQSFWGRQVHRLGVSPPPIPHNRLSVEGLGEAIRAAVTDSDMRRRAAAVGERIRAEDGVRRAVEAFHAHLAPGESRRDFRLRETRSPRRAASR